MTNTFVNCHKMFLAQGLTVTKMAEILQCSKPTARKKFHDPSRLTMAEFRDVCKALKISDWYISVMLQLKKGDGLVDLFK